MRSGEYSPGSGNNNHQGVLFVRSLSFLYWLTGHAWFELCVTIDSLGFLQWVWVCEELVFSFWLPTFSMTTKWRSTHIWCSCRGRWSSTIWTPEFTQTPSTRLMGPMWARVSFFCTFMFFSWYGTSLLYCPTKNAMFYASRKVSPVATLVVVWSRLLLWMLKVSHFSAWDSVRVGHGHPGDDVRGSGETEE